MPNYYTHVFFGLLSFIAVYYLFYSHIPEGLLFISAFASFIASIFPDIDQKDSKVFKSVKSLILIVFSIFIIATLIENVALMLFVLASWAVSHEAILAAVKPKHRGIMHSIISAFAFSALFSIAGFAIYGSIIPGIFSLASYYSHIVLDYVF